MKSPLGFDGGVDFAGGSNKPERPLPDGISGGFAVGGTKTLDRDWDSVDGSFSAEGEFSPCLQGGGANKPDRWLDEEFAGAAALGWEGGPLKRPYNELFCFGEEFAGGGFSNGLGGICDERFVGGGLDIHETAVAGSPEEMRLASGCVNKAADGGSLGAVLEDTGEANFGGGANSPDKEDCSDFVDAGDGVVAFGGEKRPDIEKQEVLGDSAGGANNPESAADDLSFIEREAAGRGDFTGGKKREETLPAVSGLVSCAKVDLGGFLGGSKKDSGFLERGGSKTEDMPPSIKSCLGEAAPIGGDPILLVVAFSFHAGCKGREGFSSPDDAGGPGNKGASRERKELVDIRARLEELRCILWDCCPSTRHKQVNSLRSSTRSLPAKLRPCNAGQ